MLTFWQLEQASCSVWLKYWQVMQWLDSVLCRMSGHLGIQVADTSHLIHYRGWIHCHVLITMRRTSYYVSGSRNWREGLSSYLYQALRILQGFWRQLRCIRIHQASEALPSYQAHQRMLPPLSQTRKNGLRKIFPVGTKNQIADALTKALSQNVFQQHCCYMCGL